MAIMAMDMIQKLKYIFVTALLAMPSLVLANEWTFEPSIKTNETYSDNVNFTNENKNTSFVNQTGIGINTRYETPHIYYDVKAESSYTTYSHNSDLNSNFLTLDSEAAIELLPNGISLFGSASIQNKPTNTFNNLYSDFISGDTTQIELYSLGLGYKTDNSDYNLDSFISYNKSTTEDNVGEYEGYSAQLNSTNGSNSTHFFWDIANKYNEKENDNRTSRSYQSEFKLGYITPYKFNPFIRYYDEDNSGTVSSTANTESNAFGAGIRWLITPRFILDVSYNKPINDSSANSEEELDKYYDVKINWRPSQRTHIKASVSERFYGKSYYLDLLHKNKRLTNTISYEESIQVFTRDNLSVLIDGELCSLSNIDADCFTTLINSGSLQDLPLVITEDNSFSLNKNLTWASLLELSRTKISLNLTKSERLNLSTDIKDVKQSAKIELSRKISPYSTVDFSSEFNETQNLVGLPQESKSQYRYYKINYSRQLNKTLSFDLSLSHLNRASDIAQFIYKENRISLELTKAL